MNDLRCIVGLHAYREPDKNHPVPSSDVSDTWALSQTPNWSVDAEVKPGAADAHRGRLIVVCQRCMKTKTITWREGPRVGRRIDGGDRGFS